MKKVDRCSRRHPQRLRPPRSLSSAIRRRFVMVRNVRKARCTRCYISADVTAGEALTITSLIVNLQRERERKASVDRKSGVSRGERISASARGKERGEHYAKTASLARLAGLAAASASARLRMLFLARESLSQSHGKIHSPPRIRQE